MRHIAVLLLLLPWLAQAEVLTSTTCTPSVTTGCFTRNTAGFASVFVDVSGTWTGSIVFEAAGSSSGPWRITRAYSLDGTGAYVSSITSNGAWSVITGGAPFFRVRASALASGSVTVTAQANTFGVPTDVVRVTGDDFGEPTVTLSTPDGGLPVAVGGVVPVSPPDGGLLVSVGNVVPVVGPDGGLPVAVSGVVPVSAPVGGLPVAVPDPVRVVGPTFGEVQVSGTVTSNPSQSFLDALAPACTYPAIPPVVSLTTTVVTVDDATITNRSEMTIVNLGTTINVWCCRGAACTPTATTAYIVRPGVALLFNGLRDSDTMRCRSASGSPDINVVEVSCGQ